MGCRLVLEVWQGWHDFAQVLISLAIAGQTNLRLTALKVSLTPGWLRLWTKLKVNRRCVVVVVVFIVVCTRVGVHSG